jgi:two-component system chemotaxis sensor kinase CheA
MEEDLMREFLQESMEGLSQLESDFVALETDPSDAERIGGIFRCIHTIKGAAGFLSLKRLESVAHAGESLLVRLRNGDCLLDAEMTSSLLAMVDAIRAILGVLDATGAEGQGDYGDLIAKLVQLSCMVKADVPEPRSDAPAPVQDPMSASVKQTRGEKSVAEASLEAAQEQPVARGVVAVPGQRSRAAENGSVKADSQGSPSVKCAPVSDSAIRVDVGLLDRVMNLVGELVLARNQILQYGASAKDPGFAKASQRLNLLTTELQEGVMKTRMQPIGNVWGKFPRVVRDLAQQLGKKISLVMDGADTELDRTIIEAIKDPLTHLVRNAVDHGIERPEVRTAGGKLDTGRLSLRAYHEGGQVNIEIADDGGGIDPAKLKARAIERGVVTREKASRMSDRESVFLIFEPGFSTAEKVTNVSGRGVGMDVVKTNIEKIGGTVDVQTAVGVGTTMKIKIPLTLAIIPALVVTSHGNRFAIPQVSLLELVRIEPSAGQRSIEAMHGTSVYRLRGHLLPLVFLDEALGLAASRVRTETINIVVLQAEDRQFGLVVDGISDTEEIVVKPLGKELKALGEFAGATIMGDGRVALILDIPGIAQRARVVNSSRERAIVDRAAVAASSNAEQEAILTFRLGEKGRMALPLSMVARLEEIAHDAIEQAAGQSVVQYRGAIMPIVDLREALGVAPSPASADMHQVIVYTENGHSVGLVVDQILDTLQESAVSKQKSRRDGILHSAIIQGRVTDILDVHSVVRAHAPGFFNEVLS